jgi:exonuclease III
MVYHQNVRGLKGKLSLLSYFLYSELAHIVCITEHHLKDQEMDLAQIEHYKFSAKFCRHQFKNGGTCIFVHESLNYDIIPTDHISKEKDIEICAIKLNLYQTNIVIIVIYRSPSGDYGYFLRKLELFLESLYTLNTELIICGDINVDYLHSHNRKQQLDMLLATYNLANIVNFSTRTVNGSSTAIDNFFIDLSQNYIIKPLINGMSDHDAQLLVMENVIVPAQELTTHHIRNFNDNTIQDFLFHLSMENWEDIFAGNNLNIIFNKFLDTYLKIFNTCFKKRKLHPLYKYNPWITKGIKKSCYNKRILNLNCRNSNDNILKNRYKRYCRILSNVIKAAKKMYNDELISKSKNKIKTTWEIIKETGNNNHQPMIKQLRINNTMINNS